MKYIKSVSIKNFFNYGPQETTIDLSGSGLANISGTNGVGKSTIIEAMIFALYGKTRQELVKDVINRNVGKDCKVSVEFVGDDGETYKVFRYRAHTTHGDKVYLFKGDKDISSKNVSDTNQDIVDYFGMPYIAFVNSTVFSSEFYSNFFSASGTDRLTVFENILSLKEVSYFYEETKKIIKECKAERDEVAAKKNIATSKVEYAQKNLDDYSAQAKEKLLELKKQREEAQKKIEEAEAEEKELEFIDVAAEKAKLSNTTLSEEYEKQIKEKKKLHDELNSMNTFPEEETELLVKYGDFDFDENKKKEEKYKTDLETIKTRESGIEKAKVQLDSSMEKVRNLKSQKEASEKELKKQNEDMAKVKEAICPYCGNPMDAEETAKKREIIEKKIKELEEDIKDFDKQLEEEKVNLTEFKDTYDTLLADVNMIRENLDKNFTSNSDVIREKYLNALKHKTEFDKTYEENCKKQAELLIEITELKEKKSKLELPKYTEEYINSIGDKLQELAKIKTDNNMIITAVNGSVKSAYDKKYADKLKAEIEEFSKEAEKIQEDLDLTDDGIKHYEYLAECCSNKSGGFKKFFIGEMIPVFNEKINQYLPFFFNDMDIKASFDKDLNDTLTCDGKEITFASLSCGQRTRMEIAAAFALFNLSRVFFSNKSGLLIVDELLDRGLDEFGIKAAISILEGFAEDAKVYVISHNPVVKENIQETLEIKKDENGFAVIK